MDTIMTKLGFIDVSSLIDRGIDRLGNWLAELFEEWTSFEIRYAHQQMKRKTRKQLLNMDEQMLKDIGITREEAEKEANRGFWD